MVLYQFVKSLWLEEENFDISPYICACSALLNMCIIRWCIIEHLRQGMVMINWSGSVSCITHRFVLTSLLSIQYLLLCKSCDMTTLHTKLYVMLPSHLKLNQILLGFFPGHLVQQPLPNTSCDVTGRTS